MRAYSLGTLPTEVVELHRVADLMDRLLGFAPRALAPRDEDLVDEPCPRGERRSTLADRRKERLEGREQPSLDLDIADRPLAVAVLELVDLGLVRVEDVVIDEDRVASTVPGSVTRIRFGSVYMLITLRSTVFGSSRR